MDHQETIALKFQMGINRSESIIQNVADTGFLIMLGVCLNGQTGSGLGAFQNLFQILPAGRGQNSGCCGKRLRHPLYTGRLKYSFENHRNLLKTK